MGITQREKTIWVIEFSPKNLTIRLVPSFLRQFPWHLPISTNWFFFLDHKNVTRIKSSYTTVLNIWILWFLKKLESFRNLVCKPFKPNEIKNFLFVNEKGLFLTRNTAHLFSRFFKFKKWPPNDWTRYSFNSPRSWFGFDFIKVISRVDALIVGTGETVVVMNLVVTHW